MMQILQVFYSIFSGLITSLGIQNELIPTGSPFLGLLALIPLYIALSNSKSFKQAGLYAGLQIMTTHIVSSYWLGYFEGFAIFTLGASALACFCFGLVFGRFLYIPFLYTGKTRNTYTFFESSKQRQLEELGGRHIWASSIRIFGFSVIWTLFEYFKSIGFLAYPWGTLSMTAYKWNFITQIADTTGVYGITFIFATFAAVVAEGILLLPTDSIKTKKTIIPYAYNAAFCLSLLLVSTFYGFIHYVIPRTPAKTIQVVLVQQNTDPWTDGHNLGIVKSQKLTNKAIEESPEPVDLVVWSESALGSVLPKGLTIYEKRPKDAPLMPFIRELKIPLITGAPVSDEKDSSDLYNAAVLFDKDANYIDFYGKSHLVPFAEYIPFSDTKLVKTVMSTLVGFSKGWKPGEKIVLFPIKNQKGEITNISAPICFEDAFADACRALHNAGSEVFINLTNDSWSMTNSSEIQHFVVASYRAIENRTTLVRCTNSGYSTVVNPAGKILVDFPLFEDYSQSITVPVYKHAKTLYSALGDWFPLLLLFGCLAFCGTLIFYLIPQYNKRKLIDISNAEYPIVIIENKPVLSEEMKELIDEYVKLAVEKYLVSLGYSKPESKTKSTKISSSKAVSETKKAISDKPISARNSDSKKTNSSKTVSVPKSATSKSRTTSAPKADSLKTVSEPKSATTQSKATKSKTTKANKLADKPAKAEKSTTTKSKTKSNKTVSEPKSATTQANSKSNKTVSEPKSPTTQSKATSTPKSATTKSKTTKTKTTKVTKLADKLAKVDKSATTKSKATKFKTPKVTNLADKPAKADKSTTTKSKTESSKTVSVQKSATTHSKTTKANKLADKPAKADKSTTTKSKTKSSKTVSKPKSATSKSRTTSTPKADSLKTVSEPKSATTQAKTTKVTKLADKPAKAEKSGTTKSKTKSSKTVSEPKSSTSKSKTTKVNKLTDKPAKADKSATTKTNTKSSKTVSAPKSATSKSRTTSAQKAATTQNKTTKAKATSVKPKIKKEDK